MLGYSCAYDNYAFNFTTSPAARKIVADFIASNVTVSGQMPVIHIVTFADGLRIDKEDVVHTG